MESRAVSGVAGFFLGLFCGLIFGAVLVAIAASRSLRRQARHHDLTVSVGEDDQLRITTDPRLGYRHQLAALRRQWEREHPESEVRGTW
jgi:hypothetical protein